MSETTVETPDVKTETVVEDVNKPADIPYSRFKEVNDELKSFKDKIAKMESDKEAARKKELEKQGEYKTLLDETTQKLEAVTTKANEWDQYKADRRKSLIDKLPEDDRDLYGGLELDKLEAHINKNTKTTIPNVDTSQPGDMGGYSTLPEAAKAYSKGEIDEKAFSKIRRSFTNRLGR